MGEARRLRTIRFHDENISKGVDQILRDLNEKTKENLKKEFSGKKEVEKDDSVSESKR